MYKKIILLILGALILAPMTSNVCLAADDKAAEAKPKKKLPKKPIYKKYKEAKKVAEANNEPILLFMLKDDEPSKFIEQKLMKFAPFLKDFAQKNIVVMLIKLKSDSKNNNKVSLKTLKEDELKLIENFGVNEALSKQLAAKDKDKKLNPSDAINYPAVVFIAPDGARELFRCPKYDVRGGVGVWLSNVVDGFRTAGLEPVISPKLEKLLEDPMKLAPKDKKK